MTAVQAVLLGIVEGITEFLPISSTGHLILAEKFLGIEQTEALKSFDIIIQLGAILAAVCVYYRTLLRSKKVLMLVLAAFVPTAILGALIHDIVKSVLLDPVVVIVALLIGGVFLIFFEWRWKGKKASIQQVEEMTFIQAFLIGIMQVLAVIPGTSRSAATIIAGMMLGVGRAAIVDFSFLLAIPTMAGATTLDLLKSAEHLSSSDLLMIALGFMTSFVTAYITIQWLLRYIRNHSFMAFGIYRIILAGLFWFFILKKP